MDNNDPYMGFDLFFVIGGYWAKDDTYHGGESHKVGRIGSQTFEVRTINTLLSHMGYDDNMRKISWFPPATPGKKEDISNNDALRKLVSYAVGSGAVTIYVVREDDPYIGRGRFNDADYLDDDVEEAEDVVDVQENISESDDNADIVVDEVDEVITDGGIDEQNGSSGSESDDLHMDIDEMKLRKFRLGQEYKTIQAFKSAIHRYAVTKRRDIKYNKSDSKRVVAICSNGMCPWRISASINSSSSRVVVRALNDDHNCTWQGKVSLLTNARIAELYIEEFRLNPHFSATQLQEKLLKRNINVPWTVCERTRLRCLNTFDDEQAESFARIFDYVAELKSSNLGSTVECEVREAKFYRFYACLHALKDGWKAACRRIIHVDGTFLKWRMTGMLLIACGRDPNEQTFPIAWAIVDAENKPNWLWFFEHLVDDLELGTGNGLTVASDQCKGLVAAVQDVLPFAEHRLCARHVYANWKKTYSGAEFEDLFWGAADAYYPAEFDRKMAQLKKISLAAYNDLKLSISCPWSRAFFTEYSTCAAVENNLGESFNAAIRIARTKPVIEMLEEIRRRVMVSNDKKRRETEKAVSEYTPKSEALVKHQIDLAKNCRPLSCGRGNYEVGYFNDRFVVQMRGGVRCSCRMYLISGIPCCHMVSALRLEKNAEQNPNSLISDWFSLEKWERCYASSLNPVNGMNLWKITTDVRVQPPPYRKPPGRPPGKNRRREKGEPKPGKQPKRGTKIHCSVCGQEGHNKTKCSNDPAPKPPKKPPGRPRVRPFQSDQPSQVASEFASQVASLSSALPRKGRGRPRKRQWDRVSSSQDCAPSHEPIYDTGPLSLPTEGYGVFTSPVTGDDYIAVGRSVTDTRDNTILPSSLYRARERKKLDVSRNRDKGLQK